MLRSRWLAWLMVCCLPAVFAGCAQRQETKTAEVAKEKGPEKTVSTGEKGDFFAAVWIRPGRIAKSGVGQSLLKLPMVADKIQGLPIDLAKVTKIEIYLAPPAGQDPGGRATSASIYTFADPVDVPTLLKVMQSTAGGPAGEARPVQRDGKTYYEMPDPPGALAYQADPHTIWVGDAGELAKIEQGVQKQGALAARLNKAKEVDLLVAVLIDPIRPMLEKEIAQGRRNAPPAVTAMADLVPSLNAGTIGLDLSGPTLLWAEFDAVDAAGAAKVQSALEQAVAMGKAQLPEARKQVPPAMALFGAPVFKLVEDGLNGTTIAKDGNQVTLNTQRPANFDQVLSTVIAMVAPMATAARQSAQQAQQSNNLKQIGLALYNYHDSRRALPPAALPTKDGKPGLSWRVAILPYLDQQPLYQQFHLDEPWDSPNNIKLLEKMPSVYRSADSADRTKTRLQVFSGKGTAFDGPKGFSFSQITDGTANTIAVVETGPDKAVEWTRPEDLPFDPENPVAALGKIGPMGVQVLLFDGSVRRIKPDPATLKAMITPNQNEEVKF